MVGKTYKLAPTGKTFEVTGESGNAFLIKWSTGDDAQLPKSDFESYINDKTLIEVDKGAGAEPSGMPEAPEATPKPAPEMAESHVEEEAHPDADTRIRRPRQRSTVTLMELADKIAHAGVSHAGE